MTESNNSIKLNEFSYYELEAIFKMVDRKIELKYEMKNKHRFLHCREDDIEIEELTLLRVKLAEHMKNVEEPSNAQRLKDGKKIKRKA